MIENSEFAKVGKAMYTENECAYDKPHARSSIAIVLHPLSRRFASQNLYPCSHPSRIRRQSDGDSQGWEARSLCMQSMRACVFVFRRRNPSAVVSRAEPISHPKLKSLLLRR